MPVVETQGVPDEELMLRVVAGDVRAFSAIYHRHSAQAFGLAMRVTGRRTAAEEATQDAFLGLWRAASTYDPSRGALKAWLLSLVRSRSIDWLRREARHSRHVELDDFITSHLEAKENTEQQVAQDDESRRIRNLLKALPDGQRQAIELAYFGGLTQAEIAVKLNSPVGTIKGRQRLALAKLQQTFADSRPVTRSAVGLHVTTERSAA
jgi:RNA polymerase sigma-70 factor (ECF subfamily)